MNYCKNITNMIDGIKQKYYIYGRWNYAKILQI